MKKRFVFAYLSTLIVFSIPVLLNIVVLINAGELLSIESIIKKQISDNSLYGSATNQNTFFYKLELIKAIQPEVVALGSSRVMQFRKEMFNVSFTNAGGAINSVTEAEKFVNEMLKWHKPKVVIFGLDDWWFNPKSPASNWKNPEYDNSLVVSFEKITAPFFWIKEGKISFNDYLKLLFFNDEIIKSKLMNSKLIGISAIKKETGFRSDGSYFYGTMLTTNNQSDYLFKDTLRRINNGVDRFEYSNIFSDDNWNKTKTILNKLKENNITVISFIPPFANTAYDQMGTLNYDYMRVLSMKASKNGIYDFRNPYLLGLTNCDFIDGFHGSEMSYLRALISFKEIQFFVNNFLVNDEYIKNFKLKLNIPFQQTEIYEETDLLGIGCNRNMRKI